MERKLREIREEVPIQFKEEAMAIEKKVKGLVDREMEAERLREEFERVEQMLLVLEQKIKDQKIEDNRELLSKIDSVKHEIIMTIVFCCANEGEKITWYGDILEREV